MTDNTIRIVRPAKLHHLLLNTHSPHKSRLLRLSYSGYHQSAIHDQLDRNSEISDSKRTLKNNEPSLYDIYNENFQAVIADTDELRKECYRLRYQVYCIECTDYEDSCVFPDQMEMDEYDQHSVHALLRHRETGKYVGTVRVIQHKNTLTAKQLPIYKLCSDNNLEIPELVPVTSIGEISRFCISHTAHTEIKDSISHNVPTVTIGLISMLYLIAMKHGIQQWCATMKKSLLRILKKLGIHFESLGPLVEHHGLRQICYQPLDIWINRIAEERHDIWEIITDKGRFCAVDK
jgi:N-acyl amino acid synthase of PEP-CTERM/exosortase system